MFRFCLLCEYTHSWVFIWQNEPFPILTEGNGFCFLLLDKYHHEKNTVWGAI